MAPRRAPRNRVVSAPAPPADAGLDVLASAAGAMDASAPVEEPAAPAMSPEVVEEPPNEAHAETPSAAAEPAEARPEATESGEDGGGVGAGAGAHEPPADDAVGRKKRRGRLEAAEQRMAVAQGKLNKKREQIERATKTGSVRPSEMARVKAWQTDAINLAKEVEKEAAEVERIRIAQQQQQAKQDARAREAVIASEASRSMSVEGLCTLVQLRLDLEHRFANTSDVNTRVWQHIHGLFVAKVNDGSVAASDARGWQALSKKYACTAHPPKSISRLGWGGVGWGGVG